MPSAKLLVNQQWSPHRYLYVTTFRTKSGGFHSSVDMRAAACAAACEGSACSGT